MRAVPRLCEVYPGICLTTEEKAWKNLSQGRKTSVRVGKTSVRVEKTSVRVVKFTPTNIIRMKYCVFQIWALCDNILSMKVCCENLHKLDFLYLQW